jgi:hypothetical protein
MPVPVSDDTIRFLMTLSRYKEPLPAKKLHTYSEKAALKARRRGLAEYNREQGWQITPQGREWLVKESYIMP